MTETITERLADFAVSADAAALPEAVVNESQRLLLDTLGCAVASLGEQGADAAVRYGRILGGPSGPASILGTSFTTSEAGAAFANAELVNALDQDPILPPGHVTPYVMPAALAAAEAKGVDGLTLLQAIAVSHEMSFRFGKAVDYLRDIKNGVVTIPPVIGYSCTIFGGTAAVGIVRSLTSEAVASALGIAASTTPVNAQRSWIAHSPPTTIKYQLAGGMATSALAAAYLAEFGHRGDREILDDREFGYPRFIGTSRWEPANLTQGLGEEWLFPGSQSYKPYPHCRILHALLDGLSDVVETNDIKPDEIDQIRAWGESWVFEPLWLNTQIGAVRDAQFSMAHGLALGAHRIPPSKRWQQGDVVFDPSVLSLMDRVTYEAHPDYDRAFGADSLARMSRVEVSARGEVFTADRSYPKGSPSPDAHTYMTDAELEAKFRRNVAEVVSDEHADTVIDMVSKLRDVMDVGEIIRLLRPGA
jgi:2-methylcitrate dehydratase PrpD